MDDNLEPTCRWRKEELSPGRYRCRSRKLVVSPGGVTLATCAGCYYRDHEPNPNDPPQQAIEVNSPQTEQPTPASFSQRVTNFALAMTTETAWRAKGGTAPTDEEKAQRRACCDPCEHRDASNDSCRLCGCYLESGLLPPRPLGKLDCATQQCPAGKWTYTGGYTPPQGAGCGSCGKKA